MRRLAYDASDPGLVSPDLAAGIRRVFEEIRLTASWPRVACSAPGRDSGGSIGSDGADDP